MRGLNLNPTIARPDHKGEVITLTIETDFGLSLTMKPFDASGSFLKVFPLTECCRAGVKISRVEFGKIAPSSISPQCSKCRIATLMVIDLIKFSRRTFVQGDWCLHASEFEALESLVAMWLDPIEAVVVTSSIESAVIEVMNSVERSCASLLKDARAKLDNRVQYEFLEAACQDFERSAL